MKRVGKYVALFFSLVLFLFLFDRGLFYLISRMEAGFYPKKEYEKRFEAFVNDKSYTTLILGTSRAYEGIHPYYIKRGLNQLAFKETFQGKGPKYNYYFYMLYKKYAGVPKVVIYGVDYFIFNLTTDPKWLARFDIEEKKEETVDYFSSPLLLVKHKKKIDNFMNNVVIRLQEVIEAGETDETLKEFYDIQKYIGEPKRNKGLVVKRSGRYLRQLYPRFPGKEGDFFIKLLDELKRDGVTVVLVGLPDHIGTYKTNFQRSDFLQYLKTLWRDYKNVYIYNYNRPNQFPLSNSLYFNDGGYGQTNSHLSLEGAKVFNEMLIEDLKKHYEGDYNIPQETWADPPAGEPL